jgi:FSR family fosmidomycin resistance protein-like MFS transporter
LALPIVLLVIAIGFASLPISKTEQSHGFKDVLKLLQRKDLMLLYLSQVCHQAVFWGMLFFLPDVLMSRDYDSWIALGGGHMLCILGAACMLVPGGYLADRFSYRTVMLAAMGSGLLFIYAFLFLPQLSPAPLLILLFCLGAALGIVNPLSVAFGNRLLPGHSGAVSALLMGLVWCVSEGIGQGGGGLLTKFFEEDGPVMALTLMGSLLLGGIVLAFQLPKENDPALVEVKA